MDYEKMARDLCVMGHPEGPQFQRIAQALREAAADAVESVRVEGNRRRGHAGSWADFENWMTAKAAALRGAK